jgi:kinetochore protein Mis12/MTW1
VESQSKRVLERRGVDTRDGVEGVSDGTRVRGDEVAALEGIVEVLGRREGGSGGNTGVVEGREEREEDGDAMDTS